MLDLTFLIPALPLAGFLFLVVFGRRLGEPLAGWIATAAVGGSFVVTVLVFLGLRARDAQERGFFEEEHFTGGGFVQTLFTWIPAGDFSVDIGFLVDPLSIAMALFITGVGTLIHLYSIGYMHGDENFSKFFVYLNLFVFSMLMLILGDNMLLTFLGWEGVGACSYLLISFWFTDTANASAGKKAFVTNRIGDWGFMVAMFLTFFTFGSISYAEFLGDTHGMAQNTATAITLLLLVGAAGKSAQFPLYLWLPDAMAGPTPVSALIHAATMVTSGVYLLTRMNPILFEAAGWSTDIIAWVGAFTALFAATVAVAQTDIKKVLAYSTVSQLGYMFLAVGTGAYVAAIFHMITHAFFKALLFLGSGSVIHGMHHDQDMRHYGGLRKLLPITSATFIVGWLAIAGVPPLSGFWSKDEILLGAWEANKALWAIGLITALLTAFYMSRQVFMTFFGRYRYADARPEEINAAWDAKVAAAQADVAAGEAKVAESRSAYETATAKAASTVEAIDPAEEAVPAAEAAAVEAEEIVATAQAALAEADDDQREAAEAELTKSTAAFESAQGAIVKAQANVETAQEAAATAKASVPTAKAAVDDYEAAEAVLRETLASVRTMDDERPEPVFELFDVPDAGEATEFLPDTVAERAEFHPHESPWTMTAPLGVLAGASIVAGAINLPVLKDLLFLEHWLEPIFVHPHVATSSTSTKVILAVVAILSGVVGIAIAAGIYLQRRMEPAVVEKAVLADGWGYDRAITAFMGGPGTKMFDFIAWFDATVIDGAVNGAAKLIKGVATPLRSVQTGLVRTYASGLALGAVALIGWFLLRAAL